MSDIPSPRLSGDHYFKYGDGYGIHPLLPNRMFVGDASTAPLSDDAFRDACVLAILQGTSIGNLTPDDAADRFTVAVLDVVDALTAERAKRKMDRAAGRPAIHSAEERSGASSSAVPSEEDAR